MLSPNGCCEEEENEQSWYLCFFRSEFITTDVSRIAAPTCISDTLLHLTLLKKYWKRAFKSKSSRSVCLHTCYIVWEPWEDIKNRIQITWIKCHIYHCQSKTTAVCISFKSVNSECVCMMNIYDQNYTRMDSARRNSIGELELQHSRYALLLCAFVLRSEERR